jgi:hypothetical protein
MQFTRIGIRFCAAICFLLAALGVKAQVNAVEYGRNRIQHKKFDWKFYQTKHFNTFFNTGGNELAKFVAQVAEEELPKVEDLVEYSLGRKADILVYNSYNDFKSTNVGLGSEYLTTGGAVKLVAGKLVVYFNGNHNDMRILVRKGIARLLVDNILFGEDLGEFASNQALLDLPKWLTDGYVEYIAENWNAQKDNDLKNAIMSGDYKNFYHFAFKKPDLAGAAFWYFIEERYKKENVTYFLYLSRIYKNLNTASQRVAKKKFKDLLNEFMEYEEEKYLKDIRRRRNAPKGRSVLVEEVGKKDFIRFQANPNPRDNSTYAVVETKEGIVKVKYVDSYGDDHILLKQGVITYNANMDPNYPILAWDPKGTKLLVIFWQSGKINMFIYDVIARYKHSKQELDGFEQVLDANFMLDNKHLVLSAVKNGHTDIFTYDIDKEVVTQVTDDVYADLDPVYVSFPNKQGIIFASNRPGNNAPNSDTVLPSRYHYNIFLVDVFNNSTKTQFKQITQLSNMKFGDARKPMPYNVNHFTFMSDENGIQNRWAGFFTTQREGLDTLYYIGEEILRNPNPKEMDSTLMAWQKDAPDSISYFQVYKDSTYTFPITNYQSSMVESRVAGDRGQVSEVRQEGDLKFLYKLRVDSAALRNRNVNARPTEYRLKQMTADKIAQGKAIAIPGNKNNRTTTPRPAADTSRPRSVFQTEFGDEEKRDTARNNNDASTIIFSANQGRNGAPAAENNTLAEAKLYNYRLKFNVDNALLGVSNTVLINRYQPYAYGAGPIKLGNNNTLNLASKVGITDVMEDIKLVAGYRTDFGFADKDVFLSFQNFRRRIDWGITYYRSTQTDYGTDAAVNSVIGGGQAIGFFGPNDVRNLFSNRVVTNLYQGNVTFPFNEVKSLRATIAYRTDKAWVRPYVQDQPVVDGLVLSDSMTKYTNAHLEYVHDNSINPAQNIYNGLRWKVYADIMMPVGSSSSKGNQTYNLGVDARHYLKIYRNFIWATRVAGDFSFGNRKIIYYLGGTDGLLMLANNRKEDRNTGQVTGYRYFNESNRPAQDAQYAYQSLAVNMRGFIQNVASGNNAVVINSEFRLPVFTTFLDKPINNSFLRNFQLVQFIDLGTAWNGAIGNLKRPTVIYQDQTEVAVKIKAGGIGPFAGGYGFGARSALLGYFVRLDAAWQMNGVFSGPPKWYLSLGLDF